MKEKNKQTTHNWKNGILTSTCVPLPIENIDTDQIIPARFLKSTDKDGFGKNLFADWRFHEDGSPKMDFVLNNKDYNGTILIAGKNFGSGSSREHAAWAVHGYGFSVVISSFFADIFKNNALNNKLLPIVVSPTFLHEIFESIEYNHKTTISIDLENQTVTLDPKTKTERFDINSYKKECLLNELDDIDYLISKKTLIEIYEKNKK